MVDIRPVGDGQAVLKYLAPYVSRVAISDSRIVACDEQSVTFRYTPSRTREPNALASDASAPEPEASANDSRSRTRKVSGQEFVRGFVQHTLPTGFQKIRYYGWMTPNCRSKLDEVKWLVWLFLGWTFYLGAGRAAQSAPRSRPAIRCGHCGGTMRIVEVSYQPRCVLPQHARTYLDRG